VLGVHYAHRWPSISHAFGLFRDGALVGCVTYGTPASSPLRNGIAGADFAGSVLELNRLVLDHNIKNDASMLVSASLRMIGGDHIVISFADISQGHRGVVYQAQVMRDKYGDDFYLAPRPRKHRYIKIIGSRGFRAKAERAIKYGRLPYP